MQRLKTPCIRANTLWLPSVLAATDVGMGVGTGVRKQVHSHLGGGRIKPYDPHGGQYSNRQKNYNYPYPLSQQLNLPRYEMMESVDIPPNENLFRACCVTGIVGIAEDTVGNNTILNSIQGGK